MALQDVILFVWKFDVNLRASFCRLLGLLIFPTVSRTEARIDKTVHIYLLHRGQRNKIVDFLNEYTSILAVSSIIVEEIIRVRSELSA